MTTVILTLLFPPLMSSSSLSESRQDSVLKKGPVIISGHVLPKYGMTGEGGE